MKRIGLYGGSFDPPHAGHMAAVNLVLASAQVDEVWLVPTGLRWDKKSHSPPEERRRLISILLATAFGRTARVKAYYGQLENQHQVSTSIGLLEELRAKYPKYEFFLIIGSDLAPRLKTWTRAEELKKRGKFIVIPRSGRPFSKAQLGGYKFRFLEGAQIPDVSSSQVRQKLRRGVNADGLVPPAVLAHISRSRLYEARIKLEETSTIYKSHFIRLQETHLWEYVSRSNCTGVVAIIAKTAANEIILTEQYRIPVNARVIDWAAGLVNDQPGDRDSASSAAIRELKEETGYRAKRMKFLERIPTSAGLTSEVVEIFMAQGVERVGTGGGVEGEAITVHKVPLHRAEEWLDNERRQGKLIDPKVYVGLHYLRRSES